MVRVQIERLGFARSLPALVGKMALFILDSDHVSLLLEGNSLIHRKAKSMEPHVGTNIVTVQEVFNGWVSQINARAAVENPVPLYMKLWNALEYFKEVPIAKFDDAAHAVFKQLLDENPQLRKNRLQKDMRIAAIALSLGATVVTRNRKDFELVPGLAIEDWTV
jgi:tRNA(fMet)-specific endonuclease VapC